MNNKKYSYYRISFLGETTMMRSDVSQETLDKLTIIVEKAIFDINQGKINTNKAEILMLVALKLASDYNNLQEKTNSQLKIETKVSAILKNLKEFSN